MDTPDGKRAVFVSPRQGLISISNIPTTNPATSAGILAQYADHNYTGINTRKTSDAGRLSSGVGNVIEGIAGEIEGISNDRADEYEDHRASAMYASQCNQYLTAIVRLTKVSFFFHQ